jgi:hypothetical protein
MPTDQDVIKQLEKSRDTWKTLAIALLILVFLVMIPFTIVTNELIQHFWPNRYEPKIVVPPRGGFDK